MFHKIIIYALDANTQLCKTFRMGTKLNSAPSVVEGLVYFGSDDGNLYAFDGHTGIERL